MRVKSMKMGGVESFEHVQKPAPRSKITGMIVDWYQTIE